MSFCLEFWIIFIHYLHINLPKGQFWSATLWPKNIKCLRWLTKLFTSSLSWHLKPYISAFNSVFLAFILSPVPRIPFLPSSLPSKLLSSSKLISGVHGWLSWLRVQLLILAPIMILELWDGASPPNTLQALHWYGAGLRFYLCLFPHAVHSFFEYKTKQKKLISNTTSFMKSFWGLGVWNLNWISLPLNPYKHFNTFISMLTRFCLL